MAGERRHTQNKDTKSQCTPQYHFVFLAVKCSLTVEKLEAAQQQPRQRTQSEVPVLPCLPKPCRTSESGDPGGLIPSGWGEVLRREGSAAP